MPRSSWRTARSWRRWTSAPAPWASGRARRPWRFTAPARSAPAAADPRRSRGKQGRLRLRKRALQPEQEGLGGQAAAETGERAIGADHPVAGQHDGQRVAAVGGADRAHRGGTPDVARQVAVAPGASVGNRSQRPPHLALEAGAMQRQRQVERLAAAVEILLQLTAGGG